jgi:tetratricopeptide (TPR) repeat protein
MRGAAWVLVIAAVGGGAVAWLVHSRRGAVDRQLDADLAAALDRGGIADLGRAQALGRRLVLGAGAGRAEAAALAFADARLAADHGVATAIEAEEILARFHLPDRRNDAANAMAASARALLAARGGDRGAAERLAAEAAAAHPGFPQPLYALGRARTLAGDLAGATRAFDAAIVVAPTFLPARVARAEVLLELGNPAAARAALEPVLAESPGDLQAELLLDEVREATSPARPQPNADVPACAAGRWTGPPRAPTPRPARARSSTSRAGWRARRCCSPS